MSYEKSVEIKLFTNYSSSSSSSSELEFFFEPVLSCSVSSEFSTIAKAFSSDSASSIRFKIS